MYLCVIEVEPYYKEIHQNQEHTNICNTTACSFQIYFFIRQLLLQERFPKDEQKHTNVRYMNKIIILVTRDRIYT